MVAFALAVNVVADRFFADLIVHFPTKEGLMGTTSSDFFAQLKVNNNRSVQCSIFFIIRNVFRVFVREFERQKILNSKADGLAKV
jgi:hypothetical protein